MNEPKASLPKKLPLGKALLWIFASVLTITGSAALGLLYFQHVHEAHKHNPAYNIVALVQTSAELEGLRTVYLAELLNLSIDHPTNLYAFDAKAAREKLMASPLIKEAAVKKIRPGTIHVDYVLRKPVAFLSDFGNTLIDAERVIIPFKPFFTPKKIPEIYLGLDRAKDDSGELLPEVSLGRPLQCPSIELAFTLFNFAINSCCDESSTLLSIDVSKAFAPSYGQRQIVMVFEDRIQRLIDGRPVFNVYPRIVRLAPDSYRQQLANYLVLRSYLRQQEKAGAGTEKLVLGKAAVMIIDMRLSELAFIGTE